MYLSLRAKPLYCAVFCVLALSTCHAQQAHSDIGQLSPTFTTVDVPGASLTTATGVNSKGDLVGYYTETSSSQPIGFEYASEVFSFFSYPGSVSTRPFRVNSSGIVAGYAAIDGGGADVGFTYDLSNFTEIRAGVKQSTVLYGFNDLGDVTGGAGFQSAPNLVFEKSGSRLRFITPPPGGYAVAYGTGINNLRDVVGWYVAATYQSFVYRKGRFAQLNYPGTTITEAWDVNDSGIVVGWFSGPVGFCGFAYHNGKFMILDYPGQLNTYALGINNLGQVVGGYDDPSGVSHGFLTSPISTVDFSRPGCCVSDPKWKEQ